MIVFSDVDVVVIIGYSFVGCGLPTILNLLGHFSVGWVIFTPRFRHQYCLLGFRSFPMGCGGGIGLLAVSFGHTPSTTKNTTRHHQNPVRRLRRRLPVTVVIPTKNATPCGMAFVVQWSCGELNPGPVTVPSVFYVRSLLAMRRFFCPHRCRRQLMASISAEKVPQPPCGAVAGASLLNDAQHLPEDEGE